MRVSIKLHWSKQIDIQMENGATSLNIHQRTASISRERFWTFLLFRFRVNWEQHIRCLWGIPTISATVALNSVFQSRHQLHPMGLCASHDGGSAEGECGPVFLLRHKWLPSVLMLESGATPSPLLLLVFPRSRPSLATQVNQKCVHVMDILYTH